MFRFGEASVQAPRTSRFLGRTQSQVICESPIFFGAIRVPNIVGVSGMLRSSGPDVRWPLLDRETG